MNNAVTSLRTWTQQHSGIWQFIKFNVLSNISTITRFACSLAGTELFVRTLGLTEPFSFLVFDYSSAGSGGLGGFLTFFIAEVAAQAVNFVVQMKLVFKSSDSFSSCAPKFCVLAVAIVICNLVLPGHVTALCLEHGVPSGVAATAASVVNTLIAIVVSYPALKFWIMPEKGNGSSQKTA